MDLSKAGTLQSKKTEIVEHERCNFFIHPDSKFKKGWSFILIFLLLYVATVMPFNIAFVDNEDAGISWEIIELCIDFCFLFDVAVNCISGYYDEDGKLVKNNKRIFCSYVKSWMVIDLLASFPFNLIENHLA